MRNDKFTMHMKGITLIALVVTIVVLLILSATSISMLTGENGLITKSQNAKTENRGASVEEARDLWKANQSSDKYTGSNTSQTLNELINDLVSKGQLTENEKDQILGNDEKGIKATYKVTIGSRTIEFEEPLELIARIEYNFAEQETFIIVNFKNNDYKSYAERILEGKTENEIIDMFVEGVKYFDSDYLTQQYPDQEITKELIFQDCEVSNLEELSTKWDYSSIDEMMICQKYVKPKEFEEQESIEGTITAPDGSTTNVNKNTYLEYKITKDGTYKFTGVASDGRTAEIELTTNNLASTYCLYWMDEWHDEVVLMNMLGEIFDILDSYNPKVKNLETGAELDASSGIEEYNGKKIICIVYIDNIDEQLGDGFIGEISIIKDGKELKLKGRIGITPPPPPA